MLLMDAYPDLKAAFGYDRNALYQHYMLHGRSEGRIGKVSRAALMNAQTFDGSRYASDYPDVASSLGISNATLYQHYVEHGAKEGRVAWSTDINVNCNLKAFDIVTSVTNGSMSNRQKVQAVHDWIIKNTAYNVSAYQSGNYSPADFVASGPLLYGTAVCSGYADAFKLCMDMLGILCRKVSGYAGGGNHAWNEVMIDGTWLSVDVTWDDPIPDRGNSVYWNKYLLISQEQMAQDHTTDHMLNIRMEGVEVMRKRILGFVVLTVFFIDYLLIGGIITGVQNALYVTIMRAFMLSMMYSGVYYLFSPIIRTFPDEIRGIRKSIKKYGVFDAIFKARLENENEVIDNDGDD